MAPGDQAEIDVKQIGVLADDMDHPEGVAVAPDGTVWCGGEAGQIYRIDPAKGRAEQVAGTGGFVLGIAFAPDGSWMAICDPKNRAVMRMDTVTMRVDTLAETVGDTHLETPNYPVFGSDGTLYVSDSGSFEQATGRVYAFDADGRGWLWAGSELTFANGMTLDANESYLYVVESFLPSICRFRIRPDGSAGPRELFTNEVVHVPDGLAFDIEGNLYCPCYAPSRIYKIDPKRRTSILVEDILCHAISNCTNVAFGGPEFTTLYIANLGRWHIAQLELPVPGLPLACHKAS